MAQVSRRPLDEKQWQMMWVRLVNLVAEDMDLPEAEVVLEGLLTETERVMLTKRLMAGVLLNSGWSVPKVALVLKLSTASVYKFKLVLEKDKKFKRFVEERFPEMVEKPARDASVKELEKLVEKYFKGLYGI